MTDVNSVLHSTCDVTILSPQITEPHYGRSDQTRSDQTRQHSLQHKTEWEHINSRLASRCQPVAETDIRVIYQSVFCQKIVSYTNDLDP